MTNQFTQAVSQHKFNTLVLNSIILGVISAILTAVFLPVGNGAFFGTTFLCLIITAAMFFPIFHVGSPSKINIGKVILIVITFGITSIFCYLSGMEILHWNIPYNEYRTTFHEYYSWYTTSVGNQEKLEYQEKKDLLSVLSLMALIFISGLLSILFGIILFGWKWLTAKKPESVNIDFFLLNPACAGFSWKRKTA